MSERVFLDANVLVSAAWHADGGLLVLWRLPDVRLLTSGYAIVEADRNVINADQRTRLHRLVQRLEIVDEPLPRRLPARIVLPAKDVPILLAAIDSGAKYLLTFFGLRHIWRCALPESDSRSPPGSAPSSGASAAP